MYVESSVDGYHCCAILRSLTDVTKAFTCIPWFKKVSVIKKLHTSRLFLLLQKILQIYKVVEEEEFRALLKKLDE